MELKITIDPVWTTSPLPGGRRFHPGLIPGIDYPAGCCTPSRVKFEISEIFQRYREQEQLNVTEEFGQLERVEVEQELERSR